MFRRVISTGALAAALVGGQAIAAYADQITGSFGVTGIYNPYSCTGGVCTQVVGSNLSTATAIDVTNIAGTTTPAVAGPVTVGDSQGQFLAVLPNGTLGTMADFSFTGTDGGGFPLPPLTGWEIFPNVTVDLTNFTFVNTTASFITLSANVLFHVAGFDNTPGTVNFTATVNGASFTFAAAESATPVPTIPEPSSMMLFGTGLFGLGSAIRRRFLNV